MKQESITLIPIIYHGMSYPKIRKKSVEMSIEPEIMELKAHFDVLGNGNLKIPNMDYSLHTDESGNPRSHDIDDEKGLVKLEKPKTPHLWKSDDWGKAFFESIKGAIKWKHGPRIIEIHPPRKKDCGSMDTFLKCYDEFEKLVKAEWSEVEIALENRDNNFLVNDASEIAELMRRIKEHVNHCDMEKSQLKIMLDIPQLISSIIESKKKSGMESGRPKINIKNLEDAFSVLDVNKDIIIGIHLYGQKYDKTGNRKAHQGNFDTLAECTGLEKKDMLNSILEFIKDKPRYFIPEVNGIDNLEKILEDLIDSDFIFSNTHRMGSTYNSTVKTVF